MLELTAEVYRAMIAHAVGGVPYEACGLFGAHPGSIRVERFHPMRNVAESSQIYQLDPAEMRAVEDAADAEGFPIIGVMHSHTHTSPYPSPTDVADAANFDPFGAWHFVIVSLRDPEPSLRSYRIADGEITEEPVVLDGRGASAYNPD